jgi:murein DD-endopeptidase MepM/ murein hydrolase activator NlpD
MRFQALGKVERRLALSAAVVMIGGFASGCSSDTARFSDGLFTGSVPRQAVVTPPANQPFPGDTMAPSRPFDAAPAASRQTHIGSVSQSDLAPVTASRLPPVGAARSERVASAEMAVPSDPPSQRGVRGGSRSGIAEPHSVGGWSRTGGTEITVDTGDTVYSLSRRFGVPAREIMAANGLTSANALPVGRRIVIPAYSRQVATASREEHREERVAAARPADAEKLRKPAGQPPVPTHAPEHVAVLPQPARSKEKIESADVAAADPADAGKHQRLRVEPASATPGKYTVAAGDSLYAIARKTGASVPDIKEANGLKSSALRVGQTLTIPGAGATQVASAEKAAAKPGVDPIMTGTAGPAGKGEAKPDDQKSNVSTYTPPRKADKQIAAVEEDDDAVAPDSTGIGKMRWPVRGRVISAFRGAGGSDGDGIDIAVPEGTPIKAAENGVVIYAGNGLKEFGNTVLVRHEDGLVTVYGHASKLEVSRGDKVRRGQEIAQSGMSGNADTPKLHFEVRQNSAPVDPRKFLE